MCILHHKSISKIFSIILIISILICAYSVNSFAASGNLDFNAFDLPYFAEYYDSQSGNYVNLSVSKNLETLNNVQVVKYVVERITQGVSNTRFCNVYKVGNLKANHEYSLSFSYAYTQSSSATFRVYLQVLNGNGTVIDSQNIYALSGAASAQLQQVNVNFVPDLTNVTQGYTMRLLFEFSQSNNLYPYTCYLSNSIYFNDNDDESAWFESIIQWLQNVRDSVSNIGANIVSGLSNLGNNISSWLTTVKDGIVNKLTEVKDGIVNKLTDIKNGIVDKLTEVKNNIGEFFTMLKNYLLYFQHPVTLNADGVPVDGQGNPVYTNPFEDTLQSVSDTLDGWFDSLDDFIFTIQSVNVQITGYLQTFTNIFNRFNAGVPIIGVIITLALIVVVIKKIMGR